MGFSTNTFELIGQLPQTVKHVLTRVIPIEFTSSHHVNEFDPVARIRQPRIIVGQVLKVLEGIAGQALQ